MQQICVKRGLRLCCLGNLLLQKLKSSFVTRGLGDLQVRIFGLIVLLFVFVDHVQSILERLVPGWSPSALLLRRYLPTEVLAAKDILCLSFKKL